MVIVKTSVIRTVPPTCMLLLLWGSLAARAVRAQPPEPWLLEKALPKVDMSALSPEQKASALGILRSEACTCGCNMKLAECRVKDPSCAFSQTRANATVRFVGAGKKTDEIKALLVNIMPPNAPLPILGEPVEINIQGAPFKGATHPKIVLVEFSDFECPFCSRAVKYAEQALKSHPNEVRLVYKQFPLDGHPHARIASEAALAALQQNKFWILHDALFANWRGLSPEKIRELAVQAGLDMKKFDADLKDPLVAKTIESDLKDGENSGVEGTPTFFVNGKKYGGAIEDMEKTIADELKGGAKTASLR